MPFGTKKMVFFIEGFPYLGMEKANAKSQEVDHVTTLCPQMGEQTVPARARRLQSVRPQVRLRILYESVHDNISQTWRPPPRTPSASSGAGGPPGAPPQPAVPSASQQRPGPAPTRLRTISRWDKMRMEEETEM